MKVQHMKCQTYQGVGGRLPGPQSTHLAPPKSLLVTSPFFFFRGADGTALTQRN